jgi:mutator protein MutT
LLVHECPPEGFAPTFEVSACFLRVGDEFLFVYSVPKNSYGSAWGVPGGKLEPGEAPEEALIREVWEETSVRLEAGKSRYFGKVYVRYPEPRLDFVYHMFEYALAEKPSLRINPGEHLAYRWVRLGDSFALTLIPGEAECIRWAYPETR